ncbi:alkaline phosphatase family protein [Caloramator sp. CAR-1]|uniref:alkaline phosphatase family protein n=1 Tax=Caloramator sp. CAR-1 TaxID=3062777 RepID=UPI0026E12C24|nr:alkaline phosphatase family protein [Caloramator sp. CAR-1]MDO6355624.1 alkaline phosphatase family protein [Caloramator sp. CAR-1]
MKILTQIFIFVTIFFMLHNFLIKTQLKALNNITFKKTNRKICIVLVDGLRLDSIKYMPFLLNMIDYKNGILYNSKAFPPTLSRPGYERIFTGSPTNINGITRNFHPVPSLIPDIFLLAKRSGYKTALSGYYWFIELFPYSFNYRYTYFNNDSRVFSNAINIIDKYNPDILLVHPMEVDKAGHRHGALSPEYEKSCENVDNNIEFLWKHIKDKNYTLIVTSDHGHKDEGGHGDGNVRCIEIPLIIIDNDIEKLNLVPKDWVSQLDVAPTICDLLNIPKNSFMTGTSLIQGNDNLSVNLVMDNRIIKLNKRFPLIFASFTAFISIMITKLFYYLRNLL